MGLPIGAEVPLCCIKVMERDFYRSSEELMVGLQCSGAECGTLDLVGVQRQTLSFQSDCTLGMLLTQP